MSSPSRSTPEPRSPSDPIRTLRQLYSLAARAFLTRSPLVHQHIERAFELIHPPAQNEDGYDNRRAMAVQRIKWDVLRLTLEASLYPVEGVASARSKGKGKAKETEHSTEAEGMPESTRSLLSLPPAVLLPALHARSVVLFTPASSKATSASLPSDVLLALVLFAIKLGLHPVAGDWVERWWAVRGEDNDGAEASATRRKIRECMVLRICPALGDWESAEAWVDGEVDETSQDQLRSALYSLRSQPAAEEKILEASLPKSSPFTPSSILPLRTPPSISRTASSASSTPRQTPARTPPPRPVSPASSTSSTASHSTHTATPTTPRPARTNLSIRSNGTARGPYRKSSQAVPIPPGAPPVAASAPPSVSIVSALLDQLRRSFSPLAWLFVILLPLIGIVMRMRRGRGAPRRGVGGSSNRVAAGVGNVGSWLWRAVRDAVDMAGRGLV